MKVLSLCSGGAAYTVLGKGLSAPWDMQPQDMEAWTYLQPATSTNHHSNPASDSSTFSCTSPVLPTAATQSHCQWGQNWKTRALG